MSSKRLRPGWGLAALALALGACGGGTGVQLEPIDDQVVAVGQELSVVLVASSGGGGDIAYSFDSSAPSIHDHARITERSDGSGIFSWTPMASDVGTWAFDFTASGSAGTDTITIQVEVRSAVGQSSAPVFRQPLGTGTMLDLSSKSCLDLDVVVDDADSTSVTIGQEAPVIEGAELTKETDLTATWHWCPNSAQIDSDSRYTLRLSADDGQNPKTMKSYVVVLRKALGTNCSGTPPVVTSEPTNESTLVGLTVVAELTDDKGFKESPLFYYSATQPADPPNLSEMTQLGMLLLDGDAKHGFWGADVPNPVVSQPAGSMATLYYVVVATDNDDENGNCDHLTQSQVYSMTVTNPGGAGGLGVCEACTADVQCGSSGGDLCVRVGFGGESFCMSECSSDDDCAGGYSCSPSAVTSVEGASGRQCIPDAGTCGPAPAAACTDDAEEDNDSFFEASGNPTIDTGTLEDLVSCPAAGLSDDDWFRFELESDMQVSVSIVGDFSSDLDLALFDSDGFVLTQSAGPTDEEGITESLSTGVYFVRVKAYVLLGAERLEENHYSLTYTTTTGGACSDDDGEPDDTLGQAREAPIWPDPYVSETNAICSGDDDYYRIELYDGEGVTIDLSFDQTEPTENLDLHFLDGSGEDLTPCTEADPSTCSSFSGQSLDSDEQYEFAVPAGIGCPCTYYVVVHGFAGSENLYDIRMQLQE